MGIIIDTYIPQNSWKNLKTQARNKALYIIKCTECWYYISHHVLSKKGSKGHLSSGRQQYHSPKIMRFKLERTSMKITDIYNRL